MVDTLLNILLLFMNGISITNAKITGDMAVVYSQYISDANNYTLSGIGKIRDWFPDDYYQKPDMVYYNKKVYKCNTSWPNKGNEPGTDETYWSLTNIGDHSFGISAQKRFRQSLGNFVNLFLACNNLNKSILQYEKIKNEKAYRKPTFCTLTLPVKVSAEHDSFIKENLFDTFIDNIVSNRNVKCYVWRAEAQLNGNIHFHIVFDRFLDYKQLKKSWYRLLKSNDLTHPRLSYEEHSRIVWIQELPQVELIKHELSGYFAADTDEDGRQYYKHKKHDEDGNPIFVRQINGRQWGDSDSLNYKPFTINNINGDITEYLGSNSLFSKQILDSNEKPVADIYVYQQIVHKAGKNPWLWKKDLHEYLTKRLHIYHMAYASKIYKNKPIDKHVWDTTFDSGQIEVEHPWRDANYKPNYKHYEYYTHNKRAARRKSFAC